MSLLDYVLDRPAYGFERNGRLIAPSRREVLAEFASRVNIFTGRKNWLPLFAWTVTGILVIPLALFLIWHFSWPLFLIGITYSMVCLGTHGTIWLHRYCTHRSFQFSHPFFRTLCRNLVIKTVPEELYVISHHVHHLISEKPGDPYNVHGGWLYCFLADTNHQTINKDLSPDDYAQLCKLMGDTGVRLNSYEQYRNWGSLCHPATTMAHYFLNWSAWYVIFYFLGGHALALAIFGLSAIWAIGIRTFNYDGHGRGKDKRRAGIDFNTRDLSINQLWPGYVAGEWHNNHHLYPSSARAGFLRYQLDLAWLFIRLWSMLGMIRSYRDSKHEFMRDHYLPFLAASGVSTKAK